MMVAVTAVRMVQVSIDQIVDVSAVWYGHVPAAGPVTVTFVVTAALVVRSAFRGVGRGFRDAVLVDGAVGDMVEVAVVQIVHVTVMMDCCMAALRAMHVGMLRVRLVCI
jgi:hypothetical protein